MALIFIEGVDRTGKSTLANELVRVLKLQDPMHHTRLLHYGPPKEDAVNEYLRPLLDYHPAVDHIVLDRAHVGERVWPKYFGRDSRMSREEQELIEEFLFSKGAVGVLATRDADEVVEAFYAAELSGQPEPLAYKDIEPAMDDFWHYFSHETICPWLSYTQDDQMPANVTSIVEVAKLEAEVSLRRDFNHEGLLASYLTDK